MDKKSHVQIAKQLSVSRHCVQTTIANYNANKTVDDKSRSGRPHATTPQTGRAIFRAAKKRRTASLKDIQQEVGASCSTYSIL